MGIRFYLMSSNKELMQESFAKKYEWGTAEEEYRIVDEPYLGYKVLLNKLSGGWRPLFRSHKAFHTFAELETFYHANQGSLEIYDECKECYTWEEYATHVINHSMRKREPVRWVYELDPLINDVKPTLHTIPCSEAEAELFLPYDHEVYDITERQARRRLGLKERKYYEPVNYRKDPDYDFDWTDGKG